MSPRDNDISKARISNKKIIAYGINKSIYLPTPRIQNMKIMVES